MKKKKLVRALNRAYCNGCSCLFFEEANICGACLAADLLGFPAPQRRLGFAEKVAKAVRKELSPQDFVKLKQLSSRVNEAQELQRINANDGLRC